MKRKINVIQEATGSCEPITRSGRVFGKTAVRITIKQGAVCPAQK
jgi:hypothetical protein